MTTTIVLAAGRSQRFGYANKLLAQVRGRPLIVGTLERVLAATDGPVCLVTGYQARRLRAALARHGPYSPRLRIVYSGVYKGIYNRHARSDMAGSLARGLVAAPRLSSAVQIHLGDMPGVDHRLVCRLRGALNRGALAARPVYRGRPGHPVRLRRGVLPDGSEIAEHGLRPVLRRLPDRVRYRLAADERCIADIDRRQMIRSRIGEHRK